MSMSKVAVLIDFANISSGFEYIKKSLNLPFKTRLDYTKLIAAITLGKDVTSKSVYIETRKDVDEKLQKGFLDYFRKTGFTVVTKESKVIKLDDGSTKHKANFDVEITFDACAHIWKRECDEVILISGDSDFAYLIDKAKGLNFQITVVSSKATLSHELRERANRLILLDYMDLNYLMFSTEKRRAA